MLKKCIKLCLKKAQIKMRSLCKLFVSNTSHILNRKEINLHSIMLKMKLTFNNKLIKLFAKHEI